MIWKFLLNSLRTPGSTLIGGIRLFTVHSCVGLPDRHDDDDDDANLSSQRTPALAFREVRRTVASFLPRDVVHL